MTVPYRDNMDATPVDGLTCLVEVERIYGLDWGRFDDRHREALARICDALPGASRGRDSTWWFGDEEDLPPYLRATAIAGGLLVRGILPEADWWAWDGQFRNAAAELPCGSRSPTEEV